MVSAPHRIPPSEAHGIAMRAHKLLEEVRDAIALSDSPAEAPARNVIDALDRVHEEYDNASSSFFRGHQDEWEKTVVAFNAKRFDFAGGYDMTALTASLRAGRTIIDEAAMMLRWGERSSPEDLSRFAAAVNESLEGVTLQEIEKQIESECAVILRPVREASSHEAPVAVTTVEPQEIAGALANQTKWEITWDSLDDKHRHVVRATLRLHEKTNRKSYSLAEIKVEAAKECDGLYVGASTVEKLSTQLQHTGFFVKEGRKFYVPKGAREWLQTILQPAKPKGFVVP